MENRINKIIELSNGTKYLVLNQAYYKQINYYFVVGVTEDEQNLTNEFRLLEEKIIDGKILLSSVEDSETIKLLAEYLAPKN